MSIYPYWIVLNYVNKRAFEHYVPVYSPKNIERKCCQYNQVKANFSPFMQQIAERPAQLLLGMAAKTLMTALFH